MKEVKVDKLDENDEKMVEILRRLGYASNVARILTFISVKKKTTSKEIEYGADLRQPEVSLGIRVLRNKGIIAKTEKHSPGKGRPTHQYALKKPMSEVMGGIKKDNEARIEGIRADLDELKELAGGISTIKT